MPILDGHFSESATIGQEVSVPKFLEDKLKKEYPNNPGAVYGTMNVLGAMHGNKETAKGKAMTAKHNRDAKLGKAKKLRGK